MKNMHILINFCFHDFMHYVIHSTCVCTNFTLLSIFKVIPRLMSFGDLTLDYKIIQASQSMSSFDSTTKMHFMSLIEIV